MATKERRPDQANGTEATRPDDSDRRELDTKEAFRPGSSEFGAMLCPAAKVGRSRLTQDELDDRDRRQLVGKTLSQLVRDFGPALAADYRKPFETGDDGYKAEVAQTVERWSSDWKSRKAACAGLVLFGPVGTGKDHLMYAAVRRLVIAGGVSARAVNGRVLAAEFRNGVTGNTSDVGIVSGYIAPDILVLCDPVPDRGELTAYQAACLYRIVDGRAKRGKITCATLNIATEKEADEALGCATWDRLIAGAWLLGCEWESYRRPAVVMTRK